MSGETQKCKNCAKEIEKSKIFMHENFCLTNNVVCDICKEPVMKTMLEEHLEEHEEERKILEQQKIEEEKNKSKEKNNPSSNATNQTNKPQNDDGNQTKKKENSEESKCRFCSFPLVKGDNHEFYCGAKQIECEYCSTKLLARDLKNHYNFCFNKIAIENLRLEDNAIPNDTDYNDYYNQHHNNDDFDNPLTKKVSDFKEDDIHYEIDDDEYVRISQMEEDERLARELAENKPEHNNHDEDMEIARRIQMEADEKLARELMDNDNHH